MGPFCYTPELILSPHDNRLLPILIEATIIQGKQVLLFKGQLFLMMLSPIHKVDAIHVVHVFCQCPLPMQLGAYAPIFQ